MFTVAVGQFEIQHASTYDKLIPKCTLIASNLHMYCIAVRSFQFVFRVRM
jgi:hypothetical protein